MTYSTYTKLAAIGRDEFDWADFRENPVKYDLFKTAYCKDLGAYCSIKKVNHDQGMFLVNFGYQDIWTPAKNLSRFCL